MKKIQLLSAFLLVSLASVLAKSPSDSAQILLDALRKIDSIEKTMNYQTGVISIGNNIATITVPRGFKFIDATQAKYVVEDLWGNGKGHNPLGILFPENGGAVIPGSYAFVVGYDPVGFVKDGDADKIDYDDLLKQIKEGQEKENIERQKAGLMTMEILGWAERPYYDKEKKVLHWAKEFKVEGEEEHTLNYDVRILGRKGILTLRAISDMSVLDSVNKNINNVLSMVTFSDGNRYADFNSKTDEVAAWTIGGLVAGKVLAKVGFFAVILKFLKFIVIGIVAIGGGIWRFITGRRKKEAEFVYQPQPAPVENPSEPQ